MKETWSSLTGQSGAIHVLKSVGMAEAKTLESAPLSGCGSSKEIRWFGYVQVTASSRKGRNTWPHCCKPWLVSVSATPKNDREEGLTSSNLKIN